MHSSQARLEGNHDSAQTPVSGVVGPDLGAHDRLVQAETAWTGFQDDGFEVVR